MFGVDIFDAALLPAVIVALSAGVLSFLSPCVLPIVPPYLAYMSGMTVSEVQANDHNRPRVTIAAFFFVLGLSTVFIFLGFAASAFGRFFLGNQQWFVIGAGIVIMAFGTHFLGVYRIKFLDRDLRIDVDRHDGSYFGAYLLGLAFAFGWTPCIGPILGAILSLAAGEASIVRGTVLLGAYAAGLGLPFFLFAVFFSRSQHLMHVMKNHLELVEKLMGLLLWTVGLLLVTGSFADLSWWLLETFPSLGYLG